MAEAPFASKPTDTASPRYSYRHDGRDCQRLPGAAAPALAQFGPNVKIELVSIPQAVDLSRKEADVFLSFFNPDARGLS